MDYTSIFAAYYSLYRAEATIPTATEDEYLIGIPLANEAINYWSIYDNTMWHGLFQTLQLSGDGDLVIAAATTQYATPADMKQAGGFLRVYDATSNATLARVPIIEPQDVQFQGDTNSYAYFIGDPNNGFTLILHPTPTTPWVGKSMDYVYYKKPKIITTGTDVTEVPDPYYIVHRMLSSRFRSSRNPYYSSAKGDAADALRTMQLTNNSGTWSNPWSLPDHSGTQWGM